MFHKVQPWVHLFSQFLQTIYPLVFPKVIIYADDTTLISPDRYLDILDENKTKAYNLFYFQLVFS